MTKEPKIPVRVRRLIAHCRDGNQTICLSHRYSDVGESNVYWLEPSGRPIGEWTVKKALELGLIEAGCDSLFDAIDSQTYRVAQ